MLMYGKKTSAECHAAIPIKRGTVLFVKFSALC